MNNKRNLIIGALVLIALSFGAGYFATPNKVKVETKEVVKTVTIKEEAKAKIVYKEKIVYRDGTVKETERTEEASNTKEGTSTESTKIAQKETIKDVGLTLSALSMFDIKGEPTYGIHVTKRVFSNITVGGIVTTDKKAGVSIGLTF